MLNKREVVFAHSPDADDAFMYYGIADSKVDTKDFLITHKLDDIQTLNLLAKRGEFGVTAISVAAYPELSDRYRIMSCGSSIGRNYGPIVVTKKQVSFDALKDMHIASPGPETTSWLLYRLFGSYSKVTQMHFEDIIPKVLSGEVDAGIVLHEGQVTYRNYNLYKVADLGEIWFDKTKLPIPLGVDMVRRDFSDRDAYLLTEILYESILYAKQNEDIALDYSLKYARGLSREDARKFVRMYVNDDTLNMGQEGKKALETLFSLAQDKGIINRAPKLDIIWLDK